MWWNVKDLILLKDDNLNLDINDRITLLASQSGIKYQEHLLLNNIGNYIPVSKDSKLDTSVKINITLETTGEDKQYIFNFGDNNCSVKSIHTVSNFSNLIPSTGIEEPVTANDIITNNPYMNDYEERINIYLLWTVRVF